MLSVITNIYNKKTKGPTLIKLFTATGKLKKFCFTTRDVRCVHHRWHGTHRYDIQLPATHASTWVHRYSPLLQWSVPKGTFITRKAKELPPWNCSQPLENWKRFFWQLEMIDVCNTGYTAYIDTIFKFLPHTRQHGCIDILHCCDDPCL
jgi:hypothetical protein